MSGFSSSLPTSTAPSTTLTPTGSPYVYTNTGSGLVRVTISGGTVTAINITTNGADSLVGLIAGAVVLRPGESVRVNYAVAPTMVATEL